MAMTFTATAIESIKREAKRAGRAAGVPHHQALNEAARARGFASWAALSAAAAGGAGPRPAIPPVGTPPARSHGGNSTPPRAPVAGLGKSERSGERRGEK